MDITLCIDQYRGAFEFTWKPSLFEPGNHEVIARRRWNGHRQISLARGRFGLVLESERVPLRHHLDFAMAAFGMPVKPGSRHLALPLRAVHDAGTATLYFVERRPWDRPVWLRERLGPIELILREKPLDKESPNWWHKPFPAHNDNGPEQYVQLVGLQFFDPSLTPESEFSIVMRREDIK